jgi:hypothetical protein
MTRGPVIDISRKNPAIVANSAIVAQEVFELKIVTLRRFFSAIFGRRF